MVNRRTFITGAGAAVLAAGRLRAAAEPLPPADPAYYGGLRVGMHTYTLRKFTFEESVEMTRKLGLKYYGFNPKHISLTSTPAQIAEARKRIADAGLSVMAVGVVAFREKDPEARRVFDFARLMGCRTISASPEIAALDVIEPLAAEYDIRVAIHNHGPSDKWPTPQFVLDHVGKRHANLGACVDVGHYKRAGVEPHEAIRLLGPRVFDAHLKDVSKAEESGRPVVMGTGVVDIKAILQALKEIRFDGNAAIEYEAEENDPIPGVEKNLEHIRQCLAGL